MGGTFGGIYRCVVMHQMENRYKWKSRNDILLEDGKIEGSIRRNLGEFETSLSEKSVSKSFCTKVHVLRRDLGSPRKGDFIFEKVHDSIGIGSRYRSKKGKFQCTLISGTVGTIISEKSSSEIKIPKGYSASRITSSISEGEGLVGVIEFGSEKNIGFTARKERGSTRSEGPKYIS